MLTDPFRPNRAVSQKVVAAILVVQAAILVAAWSLSPSQLLPKPMEVLRTWASLVRNDGMIFELYTSFVTNLQALAISTAISLALSYMVVVPVARPIVALCSRARFFGMTGFVVLFTILFGTGHWLKVSLLVFGMSVFFITSMAAVVDEIPRAEYDHARTLRMGCWRIVWEVVVLGRMDAAFEVLRQNAAIGWMMLTMVEGLSRSEGGIGTLMLNENKHFKLAAVFAIQLTILIVGIAQDQALAWLKRVACPYAHLTLEKQ